MDQLRAWWNRLGPTQRTLLAVGVPVVAVLALVSSQRRAATPATPGPAGVIPGGPIIGDGSPVGGGGGGSELFEVARTFETYVQGLEEALRSETTATHQTITEVAEALVSDATARQAALEQRLAESEAQALERERELTQRIAAKDQGPSYTGREAIVAQAYRDVLGREPDAAGLRYWASTSLGVAGIRKALAASPEGRRIGASP